MPPKPSNDKQAPKDLAAAILNHDFTPQYDADPPKNFREALALMPFDYERGELIKRLGKLAKGKLLSFTEAKEFGKHVLSTVDFIRMQLVRQKETFHDETSQDSKFWQDRLRVDERKDAHEQMNNKSIEISNLDKIEELIKALARSLGITLEKSSWIE